MGQREIVIQGAREHNLKGVDLRLPRGALITMTGVSGSGKSSLAFDTIFQEGQRRFVESLSSYARQFLGQTEKPRVEHIEGLSPTISIDQKTVNRSPRSTVGTVTEIYDHLRLLFSRLGIPHCPGCGREVSAQSAEQIVARILAEYAGRALTLLAPIVKDRKGEYRKELEALRLKGYVRARIDGAIRRLDEEVHLARYERHTIEVVLDRVEAVAAKRARLAEAVQQGLKLADGAFSILDGEKLVTFSSRLACPDCGRSLPEMEPRAFSFNSPHGACPACKGLGVADADEAEEVEPSARTICRTCAGSRLRHEALAVTFRGRSIADLVRMTVSALGAHLRDLEFEEREAPVGDPIRRELLSRLKFLDDVGLGYLTIERGTGSLSGGESQRIRLATQVGSNLRGILYVLDEPSIGLHQRDNRRLIDTLKRLRDAGA